MENKNNTVISKIKTWKDTMVNKQPLSSQNAYAISSIGSVKSMEEMYKKFQEEVLENIKFVAERGDYYCMIKFPNYLIKDNKESILNDLRKLQYKIIFSNNDIFVVTWKIE